MNEKYIFVFGGCVLKRGGAFEMVRDVEVYDVEKNQWKVLNYITESRKLCVINPGAVQISGKEILIFGGLTPTEDKKSSEENKDPTAS